MSAPENVIIILDGDKKNSARVMRSPAIYCTPINNIEAALLDEYEKEDFPYRLPLGVKHYGAKSLFAEMTRRHKVISVSQLHSYLYDGYEDAYKDLVGVLECFLSPVKKLDFPVCALQGEILNVASVELGVGFLGIEDGVAEQA
ncbi:hypothetical protein [Pseudomonas cedrina]|uniref:hypothetical protein n=1 Tax=Pseudomonas cedrina TaxID=651740 RepID=UPI002789E000|nr:hypothetical protein [Pseudomonas cedrina]MDQ0652566.1 hypothetical protein [Pseudomonas cedrina]